MTASWVYPAAAMRSASERACATDDAEFRLLGFASARPVTSRRASSSAAGHAERCERFAGARSSPTVMGFPWRCTAGGERTGVDPPDAERRVLR
jgi:hypothetical protein